jgi:hypothetical protein
MEHGSGLAAMLSMNTGKYGANTARIREIQHQGEFETIFARRGRDHGLVRRGSLPAVREARHTTADFLRRAWKLEKV